MQICPRDLSHTPHPLWSGEPFYTNYRKEWKGTLDYIMSVRDQRLTNASDGSQWILARRRVLQIPQERILSARVALPNDSFGSDHIR